MGARQHDRALTAAVGTQRECEVCFRSAVCRAICDWVISAFALRSARFSLIDFADMAEWCPSCGDLPPMAD